MPDFTTIQVSKDTAETLRKIGGTYEEAIIRSLSQIRKRRYTFPQLSKLVPKLKWDWQEERVPYDGELTNLMMHVPAGPNFLVEVRILVLSGRSIQYTIPSQENSFFKLDNMHMDLELAIPVQAGDTVRAEWYNYDGAHDHDIPVVLSMEY